MQGGGETDSFMRGRRISMVKPVAYPIFTESKSAQGVCCPERNIQLNVMRANYPFARFTWLACGPFCP